MIFSYRQYLRFLISYRQSLQLACNQVADRKTDNMPPKKSKSGGGAGGPIPAWSAKGRTAIPPDSATMVKEYYCPKTGCFKVQLEQMRQFDAAFKDVADTGLSLAKYDKHLLDLYKEIKPVFTVEQVQFTNVVLQ